MQSTRRVESRILSLVATVALLVTCTVAVLSAVAIATNRIRIVTVLTGSMTPGIPIDTLVVAAPVAARDVTVGQVIVFMPPSAYTTPGARPMVHRVASVETVRGVLEIRTKGDANEAVDPWILDANGTTLFTPVLESPAAGKAAGFLGTYGLPAVGLLLVLGMCSAALRRIWAATDAEVEASHEDGPAAELTMANATSRNAL
jgi:signal peptidase I